MTDLESGIPLPGDIGLTWISGWTGFWVSIGQWLAGDGGKWPWSRIRQARKMNPELPRGFPTHAYTVLPDGMLFEAQPGGAVISSQDEYADRAVLYLRLPLSEAQRALVRPVADGYVGTPYSFLDYLYLALWRIHVRPEWLRNRVRDSGHMICSQACDKIAEVIGCHLFDDGRLNQDVTPGDLFTLGESKGWIFQ